MCEDAKLAAEVNVHRDALREQWIAANVSKSSVYVEDDLRDAYEAGFRQASISEGAACDTLREKLVEMREAEHDISDGYVCLRRKIPGALNTPHAPTGAQVQETTEAALDILLARLVRLHRQLAELREAAGVEPGYSHEDLVILVRNAVPQIGHALELMRTEAKLRGQVAAMRGALEALKVRVDTKGNRKEPTYHDGNGWVPDWRGEIALLEVALASGTGKPEAEVIAAAKNVAKLHHESVHPFMQEEIASVAWARAISEVSRTVAALKR